MKRRGVPMGGELRVLGGRLWRALRAVSGDDAYERYRAHHATHHRGEPPLSRRAFCAEATRRKWGGVSRCC